MEEPYRYDEPKTIRFSKDQIKAIEDNKILLADICRKAVNEKIDKTKKERKKTRIELYTQGIILLAIGMFILALAATPVTFVAWIVEFSIGFFFVLMGIITIFTQKEVKFWKKKASS